MVGFKLKPTIDTAPLEYQRRAKFTTYWPLLVLRVGPGNNPAMARIRTFFIERGFDIEIQDARHLFERRHINYKLVFLVAESKEAIASLVEVHDEDLAVQNRILFSDTELESFIFKYSEVTSRRGIIGKLIQHKQEMGTFDTDVLYSTRSNWLRKEVQEDTRLGFVAWRELRLLADGDGEGEERRIFLARWVPVFSLIGMIVWTLAWIFFTKEVSPVALALAAAFFGLVNSLRPNVREEE